MDRTPINRIAAVVIGAAVLFALRQVWELPLYIAIPAGIAAYVATLAAMTLLMKRPTQP